MNREQIIEAMARAACQNMMERHGACYDTCEITGKCCGEDIDLPGTAAALTALETALGIDIAKIASGHVVCVPFGRLPQKSIYDGVMDNRERRLHYALKDLLDAVKERQGMRDSIESETLAQAERALIEARPK